MNGLFNKFMRAYLAGKYRDLQKAVHQPHDAQARWFRHLLRRAKSTEYGKDHGFRHIKDQSTFARQIPVQDYETLKPHIHRMMLGEENVLWPGQIKWFAKSSGTTSERSKYIPISRENLWRCHAKASWDSLALLYHMVSDASVFHRQNLIMGGSLSQYDAYPDTTCGDVSAILLRHLPLVARPFLTPDLKTALMDNWEIKIDRMARQCCQEDVGMFGGVPTWTIVLFRRILEMTGKDHILEVWPNAGVYMHGGVGFRPYKQTFSEFLPAQDFVYQEVYNASEGFFAAQDITHAEEMLLLVDNGMYFEFIPSEEWDKENPITIPLSAVELHQNYALVISTNSGLWRYTPGDTVMFTSTAPYRLRVTGRTQQFINAFGEEVMIDNVEAAITMACVSHHAHISEFTVAPVYLDGKQRGAHDWFIEFAQQPADLEGFRKALDLALQHLNSDYGAKRSGNLALEMLHLTPVPQGSFTRWMAHRGKFGGQNKVPRLSNDRRYVDDLTRFLSTPVRTGS